MRWPVSKLFALIPAICLTAALSACAGDLPGGRDTVNKSYYQSTTEFKDTVAGLQAGMTKAQVMARLNRQPEDFRRLTRSEIVAVLFGGSDSGVPASFHTQEDIVTFLQSLEGYRLEFKNIKKRHGFTSLIRVQTDAQGFDYTLNLVFQNGLLYEKPVLTGGTVTQSSSKTFFDYLNPGTVFGLMN